MAPYILAKYDVSGIQAYIFASNRLRENVKASAYVGKILKEMLPAALAECLNGDSERAILEWDKIEYGKFRMADSQNLLAEIIYIGGGNAFVVYRDKTCYNQASRHFAKKVTAQCQGVTVLTSSVETDLNNFSQDIRSLNQKMGEIKKKVRRQLQVSSYPIIEQDSSSGSPVARQLLQNGGPEIRRGQCAAGAGGKEEESPWSYAWEMEELAAQKGEDSYVAVIHIDGNNMGKTVESIMKKNGAYQEAVPRMRQFSAGIADKYEQARKAMVDKFGAVFGTNPLPLRPLIADGDDITYLCCAQAGIPAAVFYLRKILELSDEQLPLSACAGIAFVHNHFPFNIAYEIAEKCCAKAKKSWREKGEESNTAGYLDFQVVQGAYGKEMESGNRQEKLRGRPFRIGKDMEPQGMDSADHLFDTLKSMMGDKEGSKEWPMNRLRHLYQAYRLQPFEIDILEQEYASRGYKLSELSGRSGMDTCTEPDGIFDALEVLDFYEGNIWSGFWGASGSGGSQ